MSKLTPRYVTCPYCHKMVTNRGYRNHVNSCKMMSNADRRVVKQIRDSNK